jgi:cytochrome b6-f complex iron-sulfur subunit
MANESAAGKLNSGQPVRRTEGALSKPAGVAAHGGQPSGTLTAAEAAELHAPVTRREFLNYALLGSLGLFFVTLGGVTYLFAFPRFQAGEFGGVFSLGPSDEILPATSAPPLPDEKARIWLVNLNATSGNGKPGVLALYNVCVHLGCLYQWQPSTNRFECPCHGSKYQKDGTYIEGPAPRSLDRMSISFVDAGGKLLAETDAAGDPLPVPDPTAQLVVNTGKIILGKPHG